MNSESQRTIVLERSCLLMLTASCVATRMGETDLEATIRVLKEGRVYELGPVRKMSGMRLGTVRADIGDVLEVFADGPDAEEALRLFGKVLYECGLVEIEEFRRRHREYGVPLRKPYREEEA